MKFLISWLPNLINVDSIAPTVYGHDCPLMQSHWDMQSKTLLKLSLLSYICIFPLTVVHVSPFPSATVALTSHPAAMVNFLKHWNQDLFPKYMHMSKTQSHLVNDAKGGGGLSSVQEVVQVLWVTEVMFLGGKSWESFWLKMPKSQSSSLAVLPGHWAMLSLLMLRLYSLLPHQTTKSIRPAWS